MNRIKAFFLLIWGLTWALCSILDAALPAGTGSFSFENPRNGKTVTVYYVKADHYDPAHPPVIVLHGMNRNPGTYRDGWVELAQRHGFLVLAPYFSREEYPGTVGYNLGSLSGQSPQAIGSNASSMLSLGARDAGIREGTRG